VSGSIFNSKGVHVAMVSGSEIFDLRGKKLYDVKGVNIYRPSGELIGHLSDTRGTEKRLDRSSDRSQERDHKTGSDEHVWPSLRPRIARGIEE
jgi:hypothetical protein